MTGRSETSCPDVVLASIAWYPDQLDENRRGLVESHAAECAACREELAFVQGETLPDLPLPDPDPVYQGVLARIERGQNRAASDASSSGQPTPPRLRRVFGVRSAALAAGLAAALLGGVIGGMSVRLLGAGPSPTYAIYEPAGAPLQSSLAAASLDVMFRPDARAEEIASGLRAVDGQVVSGPTPLGVYRVALAPGSDVATAARLLRGEGQGVAIFAEPAPR